MTDGKLKAYFNRSIIYENFHTLNVTIDIYKRLYKWNFNITID